MLTMAEQTIGEIVKFYRKLRGLTMDELGDLIESNHSYISQLEANKMVPGSDVLGKLADALKVTADILLGRGEGSDSEIAPMNIDKRLEGVDINLLAIKEIDPEEFEMIAKQLAERREKLERERKEERRAKRRRSKAPAES